jgi:hypothetical protein
MNKIYFHFMFLMKIRQKDYFSTDESELLLDFFSTKPKPIPKISVMIPAKIGRKLVILGIIN